MVSFHAVLPLLVVISSVLSLPLASNDVGGPNFDNRCPASGSAHRLSSPSYPDKRPVFEICSEIDIAAPLRRVFDAVTGFDKYPQWNPFIVNVDAINGSLMQPALYDTIKITTKGVMPFPVNDTEVISALRQSDDIANVAWRLKTPLPPFLLQAEHSWILSQDKAAEQGANATDISSGLTHAVSHESFYGLLGFSVELLHKELQKGFDNQNRELKKYVEGRA